MVNCTTYFLSCQSLPWISFLWICGRIWNLDELFRAWDRALGRSVSDFPQPIKCAIIPAMVCVAKARHFPQEKLAPIVANYDVIEEGGAVLYDIRANRTAIYAVPDPYFGFVRCVKHVS